MQRRTLTLAVVLASLALASPGFAEKKEGQGKGKGGGTLVGTFQLVLSDDMEVGVADFLFTYRPGDRRLLLPPFTLSLGDFADGVFGDDADQCFPDGGPYAHDVEINSGGRDGSFIEFNETDDVIRFVGSFSAFAQDRATERHYILILEDSDSESFCPRGDGVDVNLIPEPGGFCEGLFTEVNLRSHQKRLDRISPACVTGAGKSLINVTYRISQQ